MNIKYAIVKNEMPASATEAAYLGRVIPNGVKNRAQMTESALKSEHFAEATFNAVIDAAIALTEELCAEGRDVDWGPVKFLAKMHGSLPCEDSAFTDGTASLTLDADATNEARDSVGTLTPVKVGADVLASTIKVSNEMDVATEQFGVVIGKTEFYILGNGLTLDSEGEYVKAYDKKTEILAGTAQVVSVSKGQRAKCKFNPALPAGDYVFEIATKGLVGETTPRIFRKQVTAYENPNEPALTGVKHATRIFDTGNVQEVLGRLLPAAWTAANVLTAVFQPQSLSAPTTVTLGSSDVTDVSANGFSFDVGKLHKIEYELIPGETFPVTLTLSTTDGDLGPITFTAVVP